METGLFSFVAHPDLINFTGDPAIFEEEAGKLCVRAKELSVPLELNLLGLATGRHYPNPAFWRVAARTGNDAVLSLDAHAVEHIENRQIQENGLRLAEQLGLRVTERADLTRLR